MFSALCPLFLFPQAPDTLWTKVYGGIDRDYLRSIQQTPDGGYIGAGFTYSFGAGLDDVYLIKTDSIGDTLWAKIYGGSYYDAGCAVSNTNDGGFIITGLADCHGAMDGMLYLLKTDSLGDTLWTRKFGGGGKECGNSVQQTMDGGYIALGYTSSYGSGAFDFYLVKTNSSGDSLWTKTYGGSDFDFGESVCETADSGFIMTGVTTSFGAGNMDVYLVKTNSLGDTLWTKTYGDTIDDYGNSVQQTSDGGYIIIGLTNSNEWGDYNVFMIKTNSLGDTVWTKIYGELDKSETGQSIIECSDGGFCIAGNSRPYATGKTDIYILKTDVYGDTIWTKIMSGVESNHAWSIQQTIDGGYIIGGWTKSYGAGLEDVYLIKLQPDTFSIAEQTPTTMKKNILGSTIFSGPLQLPEGKTCKVFDIIGRQIQTINPAPGIYFIEVDGEIRQKVIKIK